MEFLWNPWNVLTRMHRRKGTLSLHQRQVRSGYQLLVQNFLIYTSFIDRVVILQRPLTKEYQQSKVVFQQGFLQASLLYTYFIIMCIYTYHFHILHQRILSMYISHTNLWSGIHICISSYNTGKSALPDIYAWHLRVSAYISGKAQVPVLYRIAGNFRGR